MAAGDPVVDAAGAIQRTLTGWLDRIGARPVAVVLAALLAVAAPPAAACVATKPRTT